MTDKISKIIIAMSRAGTGLAFVVMSIAVLVQVIARLTGMTFVWTEELTRFAMLYMVAFGVGLSYRSGDLVNVDLFCESRRAPWPKRFRILSALLTVLLCVVLIGPAWTYTKIGAMQTSPALRWRMDYIHITMFIALVSLLIFASARIIGIITGHSNGLPISAEAQLMEAPELEKENS